MREKARFAPVERSHSEQGELLRAVRRIRRAANILSAGDRDHVMERRNAAIDAGERCRERRVRVDDRVKLRTGAINIAVKTPFSRWGKMTARLAIIRHRDNVRG